MVYDISNFLLMYYQVKIHILNNSKKKLKTHKIIIIIVR